MISIPGKSYNLGDGVTRRDFLRVALPDLMSKLSNVGSDSV